MGEVHTVKFIPRLREVHMLSSYQVSKMNLVLGVVGFTIIWLAIGYGSPFLCDIIGFIFPAYLSFKAVESADTRDDTQWLTYWIVYR